MATVTFVSRKPCQALHGLISRISGYVSKSAPSCFLETAELVFPMVFNLGQPWDIRLGHEGETKRTASFTAGLFPGPVAVSCDGEAELVQVDLTPVGAARLFGGASSDLAAKVVDLDAVDRFDGAFEAIHDQLDQTKDWHRRFDLVEQFLLPRFAHASSIHVQQSWHLLARGKTVAETAKAIGWSTRHLSTRFRNETGIRPVTAARMLRFQRARAIALGAGRASWAEIATDVGYADQAHLIREFRVFSGETPMAWAQREKPAEPRLQI